MAPLLANLAANSFIAAATVFGDPFLSNCEASVLGTPLSLIPYPIQGAQFFVVPFVANAFQIRDPRSEIPHGKPQAPSLKPRASSLLAEPLQPQRPLDQHPSHVLPKKNPFSKPPDWAERRRQHNHVRQQRPVTLSRKPMLMPQALERSRKHLVSKGEGRVKVNDPRTQSLANPEVTSLERHLVSHFQHPGRWAGKDPLARRCHRLRMRVHVPSHVETDVWRSQNQGLDRQFNHLNLRYTRPRQFACAGGACFAVA